MEYSGGPFISCLTRFFPPAELGTATDSEDMDDFGEEEGWGGIDDDDFDVDMHDDDDKEDLMGHNNEDEESQADS